MIIAGFGLRSGARLASLQGALAAAGNPSLAALAVPADKADHTALAELAKALALPLIAVPVGDLPHQITATLAPHQPLRYGAGSVAEASALAACGPGARLIRERQIAPDGMATVALAEGPDP